MNIEQCHYFRCIMFLQIDMDDINLKGWSRAEFLKEYDNLPSDEGSIIDTDLDEECDEIEFDVIVDVEDNVQQDEIVDVFVDNSESDDSEWNIPLDQIRDRQKQLQYDADPIWGQTTNILSPPDFTHYSGVTQVVRQIQDPSPYQLFKLLFDDDIINNLVFQTNLYANQKYQLSGNKYIPTTEEEINVFLGINLLMGIKTMPSYKDYWSSNPDLHDAYISQLMPVNRFSWLLNHIHVNDNNLMPGRRDQNYDKLYKLRPMLTKLAENFEKCLCPDKCVAIDESMIRFKGRSSLKQYMPKKPIKRGYKIWVLADKSGYLYKFDIYTGKTDNVTVEKNLASKVVKNLLIGFEEKHHHVYFDNYFNSYPLLLDLKKKDIHACGTINSTRKKLPKLEDDKSLARGDFDWQTSNTGLFICKWKDKRSVYLLSNFHSPQDTTSVRRRERNGDVIEVPCPKVLVDYNSNMNFVDKFDQLKATYEVNRKSHKWWHRILFHFLDVCVVNAHILNKLLQGGNAVSQKDFRRRIVDGLLSNRLVTLKRKLDRSSTRSPIRISKHKPTVPVEIRLTSSSHQPIRDTRKRCAKCSTKAKQVRTEWMCSVCKVPLCLSKTKSCFQDYHTRVRIFLNIAIKFFLTTISL